jgi:hypothetical protein
MMQDISTHVSRVANETYSHGRQVMPAQPWWNNLESNFHKFPDDFELGLRTELMVDATAMIDQLAGLVGGTLLGGTVIPSSLRPGKLRKDMSMMDVYRDMADTGDPAEFFVRPDSSSIEIRRAPVGNLNFIPEDGACELLTFESPFEAVHPNIRKEFGKKRRTLTAAAQHWTHSGGPRPTICVIHGFMADPYWLNRRFLALPWFYKQGYDILLYTLPHHGSRRSGLSLFSGQGMFGGGIANLNESMALAVHDFRVFMDYLESRGVDNIGVTGISLGGYTSALLATVEDRLKFSIPNVPVASIVDLVLGLFPANLPVKAVLKATETAVSEIRHMLAVHTPLTYRPILPKERRMIIAGAGDRLAPPKHARLLWEHWDRPDIHWFPGNHMMHLDKGRYLKEMLNFMRTIDFCP